MITDAFEFSPGTTPLLVSMPHSGLKLTDTVSAGLTDEAKKLADTDWYIPQLYDFLRDLGVGVISANYSRYVLDLNRSLDDQPLYAGKVTGLFPDISFAEQALFKSGLEPSETERTHYKQQIWKPYHQQVNDELLRLKAIHGRAVLFDAHSIAPVVPMLFEGRLPDFNFGTNSGASCRGGLSEQLEKKVANYSADRYTCVSNGRFKGGYITRFFGRPEEGVDAVQLELSQATYLTEAANLPTAKEYLLDPEKLTRLKPLLSLIIQHLVSGDFCSDS